MLCVHGPTLTKHCYTLQIIVIYTGHLTGKAHRNNNYYSLSSIADTQKVKIGTDIIIKISRPIKTIDRVVNLKVPDSNNFNNIMNLPKGIGHFTVVCSVT